MDYYDAFFFPGTPIHYSQEVSAGERFLDFPMVARPWVRAQRWAKSRPPRSWWFGEHDQRPNVEIVDVTRRGGS